MEMAIRSCQQPCNLSQRATALVVRVMGGKRERGRRRVERRREPLLIDGVFGWG